MIGDFTRKDRMKLGKLYDRTLRRDHEFIASYDKGNAKQVSGDLDVLLNVKETVFLLTNALE